MAKRRIKDLTTTATAADLKTGNFFPLDGTEGTKKVPAELLKVPTSLAAFSDDAEHRLVTDDEKTAWDGKQDAMSVAADSTTAFDNATTIVVTKSGSSLLTRTAFNLYNYIKGKLDFVYATASALASHTSNTSNPHSVTKAQVGLGSVDNTSDANKPISTATQTALDGKAAKNTYSVSNSASAASGRKLAYCTGFVPSAPNTQTRIRYFARTGSGKSRQGTLYVECAASGYNVRDVVGNITGDGLSGLKFQYAFTTGVGGPRMTIYALLGVSASLSYCIESADTSAWTIANTVSTDTGLTDAVVEFDTPTTREIDGSVVSANQLEESGIYIVKGATPANYMTPYTATLMILVNKLSDNEIYQHCFVMGYSMSYLGTRSKVNSSWGSSWEQMQMAANISGNAATATNATNATNADKVDGKHLQVLANVPDDYDTDSVYLIYGGN